MNIGLKFIYGYFEKFVETVLTGVSKKRLSLQAYDGKQLNFRKKSLSEQYFIIFNFEILFIYDKLKIKHKRYVSFDDKRNINNLSTHT